MLFKELILRNYQFVFDILRCFCKFSSQWSLLVIKKMLIIHLELANHKKQFEKWSNWAKNVKKTIKVKNLSTFLAKIKYFQLEFFKNPRSK